MRTIAIVNQKGGCGKTTTAINLAALYAARGLRTLVVDMDPQSHCAAGLGVPEARIEYSIGDALVATHTSSFDPAPLIWEVARNLYLAPSTVMLSALEAPGGGLHQLPDKDRRLESLLNFPALRDRFDRCLIDCPPTIGLLTFNAMRAAREALIPVETGFFSLKGAERQWNTIQRLISHIGRPVACHILPTLHNPQSQLACNILAALRRQFAGQILPMVIHEHEVLREAASFGQPVLEYAPDSEARRDFDALVDWLEEHAATPAVTIEVMASHAPTELSPAQARAIDLLANPEPSAPRLQPVPQMRTTNGATVKLEAGSRAAELARRVHDLAARSQRPREVESKPQTIVSIAAPAELAATPIQELAAIIAHPMNEPIVAQHLSDPVQIDISVAPEVHSAPVLVAEFTTPHAAPNIAHILGVKKISQGVLFVQPANGAQSVAIAGEFNLWSSSAHPLKLNTELGVFEAVIQVPPGLYQYRVVVDGQWIADPYNDLRQLNCYGEPNSVVIVS